MTKILVVEDDRIIQKIMRIRLKSMGYDVVIAGDGLEAVALAQEVQPDIILMDLWLPQLMGWEATVKIKAIMDVPIIALTGAAEADEKKKMLDAGCAICLTKPVDISDLVEQMNLLL